MQATSIQGVARGEPVHSRLYHWMTRRFSLAERIYLAAFTTVAAVFLCLASGLYAQRHLAAITHEILDVQIGSMVSAYRIRDSLMDYDSSLFRYLATHDLRDLEASHTARQDVAVEIERLRVLAGGQVARSLIRPLRNESADYFSLSVRLLGMSRRNSLSPGAGIISKWSWLHRQGKQTQEVRDISAAGEQHLYRIFELCKALLVLNQRQLELAQVEMNEALDENHRIALATGITACGLAILAALGLAASLLGSLHQLLRGVERVEQGDLDFEIPITTGDEVGSLTQAFNRMARTVKEQRQRLFHETITDGLTGAYNLRHFRRVLRQEIDRARRTGGSLCLLIADIDNFKNCNDSQGHEFGNEILKRVFGAVRESLRDIDFLARYGGDELALILPNTSAEPARALAERIQQAFLTLLLPGLEGLPKGRITLSIGGASFPRDAATVDDLVVRADKALYAAKTSGRDCVRWAL